MLSLPFFLQRIEWEKLLNKEVPPVFKPIVRSKYDISNFDEEFTREEPILTPPKNPRLLRNKEQVGWGTRGKSACWWHTRMGTVSPKQRTNLANYTDIVSA